MSADTKQPSSQENASQDSGEKGAPDKRKWRLIALAVLLLGLGGAAALYYLRPQTSAEEPPDRPPIVNTIALEERSEPLIVTGRGRVEPSIEIALSPQVSGRIIYVSPKLASGNKVSRGEVLMRIEPADFENRLAQQQARIAEAQVGLEEAIEARETRREEFARLKERLAAGAGGRDARGELEADFVRPAEAQNSSGAPSGDALPVEPSRLALGEPQVEAARAALKGAKAQLANAQLALRRTVIKAPFDAIIRTAAAERGQFVRVGEQLASIYDASRVEVPVPLTEDKAALLPALFSSLPQSRRADAQVKLEYGGKAYRWPGKLARSSASIDPDTRTISAIVEVARPFSGGVPEKGGANAGQSPALLPGFLVEVEFSAPAPLRYFAVPREAVRAGNTLWIAREGRVKFVDASIIAREDATAYVTAPELENGDQIITSDLPTITNGLEIRLAEKRSTPALKAKQQGGNEPAFDDASAP